ncbi:MAG TPA: hypothetical protein VE173_16115 [Longimicrobiales bacterium]|nr:hypothetical protein [Longimicrobiales bacterium]
MTDAEWHDTRTTTPTGDSVEADDEVRIESSAMDDVTPSEEVARGEIGTSTPLFPDDAREDLRARWEEIQAEFVDEPRRSVEEADRLVGETTKRLTESFAGVRHDLEDGWKRGGEVSTEDLRVALRHYRSFFGRLLST